ncbi:MAG: GDSL-type esterase/lipase family protein [Thermoplasmatota archaeon]
MRGALALTLFALLSSLLPGCLSTDGGVHPGAIVAFGDSYTEGTGASRAEAYPALMTQALGRKVVNAGVNGETAQEAFPRLERDVLRHDPSLVIVEFGVNEAYRGYPVERALAGLEAILQVLEAEGIPAILVGVHFWDYQENFDAGLRELGRQYGAPVVLDVLDGILDDPALRSDPFHPNAAGYAIMETRIRPTVQGMLTVLEADAATAS